MKPFVEPLDYSKSKVKDVDINSYFTGDIKEITETPDARAALVHNVGCLLSQTRERIIGCHYYIDDDGREYAEIEYKGGHRVRVNIECDSWMAIIKDIINVIET